MNVNKETMLRRLQAADFVLHETVLYLCLKDDAHTDFYKLYFIYFLYCW